MRKLILCLILLLLPVHALAGVVAQGSVSAANMKLSTVNGTAFVDFSSAGVFTGYEGCKLTITDSTGDKLIGYISTMGIAEALEADTIVNGALVDGNSDGKADNWLSEYSDSSTYLSIVTGFGFPGNAQRAYDNLDLVGGLDIYQNRSFTSGTLYKSTFYQRSNHTLFRFVMGTCGTYSPGINVGDATQKTYYATATSTSASSKFRFYLERNNGRYFEAGGPTLQLVTAPSATGATIVSAKDGSVSNWTSTDASFTVNDASGYTYTIEKMVKGKKPRWSRLDGLREPRGRID